MKSNKKVSREYRQKIHNRLFPEPAQQESLNEQGDETKPSDIITKIDALIHMSDLDGSDHTGFRVDARRLLCEVRAALSKPDTAAQPACKECGGSGWIATNQVEVEDCPNGCKAPATKGQP